MAEDKLNSFHLSLLTCFLPLSHPSHRYCIKTFDEPYLLNRCDTFKVLIPSRCAANLETTSRVAINR